MITVQLTRITTHERMLYDENSQKTEQNTDEKN